jgi:hypothetical protein
MPTGPSGARWCRLLLIVLVVLAMPTGSDTYADDGWMAVSDAADSDESRLRIAAGALSDSSWIRSAPTCAGRVGRPDPLELVVTGRTCLTPADGAPPRA